MMRWKTPEPKRRPVSGDKKVRRHFAFFPTDLEDGTTIWLGFYWQRYVYGVCNGIVFDEWTWLYLGKPTKERPR